MSNLNNNTTQLEALLVKVNALPDAGGKTCTIQINNTVSTMWSYSYTTYDGTRFSGKCNDDMYEGVGVNNVTISNVVCGSVVTVVGSPGVGEEYSTLSDNTMQFIGGHPNTGVIVFTAPTTPNTTVTATLGCYIP